MDCLTIPELSYSEFAGRFRQKLVGQRIPIKGSLELNFRCNLRCQHCYVGHGHTGLPGQQELSLVEIERILNEIVNEGCMWLLLTGGEPLIRKDFKDIYLAAKQKGLLLSLFTNGTLLTRPMVDFLAEYRPLNIEITLYGMTQETYELVTGIPGSYRKCMRGIELLLERDLTLGLKTMVMTINQHELQDMQAFAKSLGVKFRYDAMLNARLDGCAKPLDLRLPPQQYIQLEKQDTRLVDGMKEYAARMKDTKTDASQLYTCGAGIQSFHIDPYGNLCLCLISRQASYNLRRGTFREGWHDFLQRERSKPTPPGYSCQQCELLATCGQCPGWSLLEHGREDKKVSYLCQVAHLRQIEILSQ